MQGVILRLPCPNSRLCDLKRYSGANFGRRISPEGKLKKFSEETTISHLKKKILVQYRGGTEFQPAGILQYFEDLKRDANKEIGTKDFFEIASNASNV